MIENRLSGQTIDSVWKFLNNQDKDSIIDDIIKFLINIKSIKEKEFYSVNNGNSYNKYWQFLIDGLETKILKIKEFTEVEDIIKEISSILLEDNTKKVFSETTPSLVHGDLIIHNLLTDQHHLTGVLDWEFAEWGDSDYDLARIFYYHECAKAYEQRYR